MPFLTRGPGPPSRPVPNVPIPSEGHCRTSFVASSACSCLERGEVSVFSSDHAEKERASERYQQRETARERERERQKEGARKRERETERERESERGPTSTACLTRPNRPLATACLRSRAIRCKVNITSQPSTSHPSAL